MPKGSENLFANCTFAVVATNARLDRREANTVAESAMAGFARTIRPAHTPYDFDAVIVLSCGLEKPDLLALGSVAADCVAEAFVQGARGD